MTFIGLKLLQYDEHGTVMQGLNKHVLASSQSRNNLQPSEFSGYQKQGDLTSCCSEFNNFFLNEKFNSLFLAQLCSLRAWQHQPLYWRRKVQVPLSWRYPRSQGWYLRPVNEQSLIDCSVEDEVEIATRVVLLVYLQSKEGPVMKN